jgi:dephospho-CoA kinase
MLHIGLTGGLATGKSTVGRMLSELGCYVIQMDDLGHKVIEPGGEAYASVIAHFGSEILEFVAGQLRIDRRRLGALVFANPAELGRLNALLHPPIRARAKALADAFAKDHPDGLMVTEAAILIETKSYKEYDRLVVAACSRDQQIERAMARDDGRGGHLSREEVSRRLDRQMPIEEKVKYANYIVDTSGTMEHVAQQVADLYRSLTALARGFQARKESQS